MADLPTIKIKAANALGYMIINQADFDPKKHQPCEKARPKSRKGKSQLIDLMKLSNKDLAAWARESLGLEDLDGRTARSKLMKRINAALAAQQDG